MKEVAGLIIYLVIIALACAIILPSIIPHRVENIIFKNPEFIDGKMRFTIAHGDKWFGTYAPVNSIEVQSRNDGTIHTTLSGRLRVGIFGNSWRKVTIWVGSEADLRIWQEYLQGIRQGNNLDYDGSHRVLPPETP